MKKVIRKVGAGFLALLMVLQALNSTMVVVAEELKKIDLAAPYGEYYNVDLQPEVVDQEKTDSNSEDTTDEIEDTVEDSADSEEIVEDEQPKEVATKEASVYTDTSEYEGYPEVEDKRTINSKTYEIQSGLYVQETFFEPIHKEVDGKLEDIDNTLENISVARSAAPIFQNKDGLYNFTLINQHAEMSSEDGSKLEWEYTDADFSRYDVKENVVLFTNIYNNVDLEYVLSGNKVHTTYVINGRLDTNTISYQVKLNGLTPVQEEGYIDFKDVDGNSIFEIVNPILSDQDDKYSQTDFSFTNVDKDTIKVTVAFEETWVNNSERVYPLRMTAKTEYDPKVIHVESGYNRSNQPSTVSDYYHLFVGYDNEAMTGVPGSDIGTARSYIHVSGLDIGSDKMIVSAQLALFNVNARPDLTHSTTIDVYKTGGYVNPATTDWINKPTDVTKISSNNIPVAEGWVTLNVTDYIADIYAGKNNTLELRANPETAPYYGMVFWGEDSVANRPRIAVTYRDAWDVDPALDINKFDTEMRIIAKLNEGFHAITFDGIAKPDSDVEFHLQELKADGSRTDVSVFKAMAKADKYFVTPTVVANNLGDAYSVIEPYAGDTGRDVNYTTDYITEDKIPKFGTFYEFAVKVRKGSEVSTKEFYSDGIIKYKVQIGDNLKSISAYYGVDIETIKKENNLTSNKLKEGQILLVRFKKNNPKVPVDVYTPPLTTDTYIAEYLGPACYGTCVIGDPIDSVTGNFYYETTDFTLVDFDEIEFNRYYNSMGTRASNMFGNGFTTPLEQYIGYDENDNISFFRGDGKILQINKEASGYKVKDTNKIEFKQIGNEIEIKDTETGKIYLFDDYGTLIKITEKNGYESEIIYNEYGQITEMKLGEKSISFVYNENNLVKEIRLPSGKSTKYEYDKNRNLVSMTNAQGNKETYKYDKNNFMTSVIDFNGVSIANNTYDDKGSIKTQSDGNGNILNFKYSSGKTNISYTGGTSYSYEHKNNKTTKMISSDGSESSYEYDSYGNIIKKIDALGEITKYEFNRHDLTKVVYNDGTSESYTYDNNHNITSHTHKDGSKDIYAYSGKDLVKHTKPNGEFITYSYDGSHRITSETNHLGVSKTYSYTGNHITKVEHTSGLVESYTYDVNGNMLSETDNQGKISTYTYNDNNKVTSKTYYDGTKEEWRYDGNGNIVEYVDRLGALSKNYYDKNNNLTKTIKGTLSIRNTYDMYDHLISETDEQGLMTKYEYDNNFRKTAKVDAYGNKTTYEYDNVGNILKVTDSQGNTEEMTYNNGNVIKLVGFDNLVTEYEYDDYGRLIEQTNPNETVETKKYSGLNLVEETDSFGHVTTYEYDKYGRQTKSTKTVDGESIATDYTYDKYNNLTKTSIDGVATTSTFDVYAQETSTTDALGNTTKKEYNLDGNIVAEVDAKGNRTTTAYDANGNITKEVDKNGNATIKNYDKDNFLKSETDAMGFTTTYTYNANGQCITETDAYGIKSEYIYDAYNNVIETKVDGITLEKKTFDKYGQETNVKTLSEHTSTSYDNLGRTVSQTNEYTGLVNYMEYDEYGNVIKEYDSEGKETTKTYDQYQRKIQSIDAYGRESNSVYDNAGNVVETNSYTGTTTTTYDKYGNQLSTTNELGLTTTYEYDKLHNKTKETVDEKEISYVYDANYQVIEAKDINRGTSIKTVYDANGNITETTDALGNVSKTVYDKKNQETETIDALGNKSTKLYDANGNITKTTDALGNTTQTTFNSLGQTELEIDERGFSTTYIYDEDHRLVELVDKLGNSSYVEYNDANQIAKEIDGRGSSKTYVYDVYGQTVEESDKRGKITTKEYDVLGNVIEETFGEKVITNKYDDNGNLLTTTQNDRVVTTNEYNELNQLVATYDAKDGATIYEYDVYGNVIKTDDKGYVTESTYNVYGELLEQTTNSTFKEDYEYDVLSRQTKTITNGKTSLEKEYDAVGNEIKTIEYGKAKETVYDKLNRETELKLMADNGSMVSVQKVVYNESGNIIETEDGNGNVTYSTFDANGNETSKTNAKGVEELYEYDANNNLVKAQNPQGRVVSYIYSTNDQVTMKEVNNVYASYRYDMYGNLTKEENEYGYLHEYEYDLFGNNTKYIKPDGSTIKYEYDANNNLIAKTGAKYTYDERGNLISAKNSEGTVKYEYNSFNQIRWVKDTQDQKVTYMYDKDRNVKSITYGNGDIVEYSYNDYNLVRNVKKNGKVVTTYHYNNRGEITKQTQDQVVNTYSYDNEGNLASLKTMNRGEEVYNITYAYDETNNLVQEIINGNENNYTYNENDELEVSRKYIDGEVVKTTYGYDLFGNKTVLSSSEGKKTYTYNDENQLEKIETDDGFITYRYDDNGNITHRINEDGSKEVYRYDREDQLTHVQKGEDIYKYAYDAEGERITEVKVDVRDYPMLTWYNYTVNMEFEDVKKDHNETFEMLREQVAKREANDNTCDVKVTAHKETTYRKDPEITYYTLDRNQEYTVVLQENGESNVYANEKIVLSGDEKQVVGLNGSIIAEVDEDEEITTHNYSDYGVSNTKEEGHAYNGEYVQSNGLIYLRARYYDPTIGNFIQIDNNYAGEAENVATQNRYNYTLSNPYKYTDPSGNINVPGVKDTWYSLSKKEFEKKIKKFPFARKNLALAEYERRNKKVPSLGSHAKTPTNKTNSTTSLIDKIPTMAGAVGATLLGGPEIAPIGFGGLINGVSSVINFLSSFSPITTGINIALLLNDLTGGLLGDLSSAVWEEICSFFNSPRDVVGMDEVFDFKKNNPDKWEEINGDQILQEYGYNGTYIPSDVTYTAGGFVLNTDTAAQRDNGFIDVPKELGRIAKKYEDEDYACEKATNEMSEFMNSIGESYEIIKLHFIYPYPRSVEGVWCISRNRNVSVNGKHYGLVYEESVVFCNQHPIPWTIKRWINDFMGLPESTRTIDPAKYSAYA